MKLLMTHRFFWPDTAPYALLLRAIASRLAAEGHEVSVLASVPSYRQKSGTVRRTEVLDGVTVRRIWVFNDEKRSSLLRLANLLIYCSALFWAVIRSRPDVVTAAAFPPVFAAWTASLACWLTGARFVYHVQDVHPEVSAISGGLFGRGLPMRLLQSMDNWTLRHSAAIVVLSRDMADTLNRRCIGPLPLHVINNFELDSFGTSEPPPPELRKAQGRIRVIFAGNLGRFQNLPLLAEGVAQLFEARPMLELFFLGDGAALADLKARWEGHPQVGFGPFLPFAQARAIIAEADIGLVSLLPGLYRVAYPSKALTYLALGVPVLALVEPESNLAKDLAKHGHGRVPPTQTPQAIAATLAAMLDAPVPFRADLTPSREAAEARWVALVDGLQP